jgi:L-methionine (R)-S-oxide reductase
LGSGVCGTAGLKKEAVMVDDVSKFPGHIACDPDSASEIVVPIIKDGILKAVIDIDSAEINSFSQVDEKYLKEIALICSKLF